MQLTVLAANDFTLKLKIGNLPTDWNCYNVRIGDKVKPWPDWDNALMPYAPSWIQVDPGIGEKPS